MIMHGYWRNSILRIALMCIISLLLISITQGSVLIVDKNNPNSYKSINEVLQKSKDGDVIEVHGGTYTERVVINKRISIKGVPKESGKPIIDFRPYTGYKIKIPGEDIYYWGVLINIDDAIFEGFDLIGKADSDYGIVINSNNVTIRGNNVNGLKEGIFVNGSNNVISENSISNCKDRGIYLKCLGGNIIVDNMITGNAFGIWIGGQSLKNLIYCNNLTSNGLNAYDLSGSSTWNNDIIGNYYGDFHQPDQGCIDANLDNICDDPHEIQGKDSVNRSIDQHPLVSQSSPPCCPLRIQILPSIKNVTVGQNITFTCTLSNYGLARLGNVHLNNSKTGDLFLEGLKLEPSQSVKINQSYVISNSDFPGPLNITVSAICTEFSTFKKVGSTATAFVSVLSQPHICLKGITSADEAEADQNIPYKYILLNCGNRTLEDIYLNDSKTNGYILKNIALESNKSLTVSKSYTINDTDLPGPLNITAAAIGKDNLTGVKVTASGSVLIRIRPSDLNLSMSANSSCIRNLTDGINFTIAVNNNGPGKGKGIVVHDTIPDNSEFTSAYPNGYDLNSGNWHLDSLDVGKTAKFYLEVKPKANGSLNNSAFVISNTTDHNRADNYYIFNILNCTSENTTSKVHLIKKPNIVQKNLEDIQRKIDNFRRGVRSNM